jgi:hypothetical protein
MCDTAVAVGTATASGHVLFAKNSDRSPNECHPLFHAPRRAHPSGATLTCQYIEAQARRLTQDASEADARQILRQFVDATLTTLDQTVAQADVLLDEAAAVAEPPIVLQPRHRAALNAAAGLLDREPGAPVGVPAT